MIRTLSSLIPEPIKVMIGGQIRSFRLSSLEKKAYKAFRDQPRNERIKLLIFAQGRTGSTVLESLISSNKSFIPLHEVISQANTAWKKKLKDPNQYIEGLSRLYPDKNIVCHIKINHLIAHQQLDPIEFMKKIPDDWKVIYLYRENIVMHALSTFIADKRETYHTMDMELKLDSIPIDLRFFQKLAKGRFKDRQDEIEILGDRERLDIKYEDDILGPEAQQRTVKRIADFLGIEAWQASTPFRKVNNAKLSDLISNYDDFMTCIRENAWEQFVEGR